MSRAQGGGWSSRSGLPYSCEPHTTRTLAQVLRQVDSRLNRFTDIDRRHQKVTALLLLQDGGKGGLGLTSSGGDVCHPSRNRRETTTTQVETDGDRAAPPSTLGKRLPFPTGRRRAETGPQSCFSAGAEGGKTNSSRRRGVGLTRAPRNKSRSCNSSNVLGPGGGALTAMLSRFAVGSVGRDIARARKGTRNMSDGSYCGEMRVVSSSLPEGPFDVDETRGVLFGFGSRLGRHYQREDIWL